MMRPDNRNLWRFSMPARAHFVAATVLLLCFPWRAPAQESSKGVASPSPASAPAGWTLVFSDEFDRPRRARRGEVGVRDRLHPQPGGAVLHVARRERPRGERQPGDRSAEGVLPGLRLYLGQHQHARRFEFLYGRVEVRAKIPTGNGTWPAIWMLGVNRKEVGWPACGEIDIMENVGFNPLRILGSVHTAAYNHTIGTHKSANVTVANPWRTSTSTRWSGTRTASTSSWTGRSTSRSATRGPARHVALRQAAVPADQPGDWRFVGRAEGYRRRAVPAPLRRRLRADLPAAVTAGQSSFPRMREARQAYTLVTEGTGRGPSIRDWWSRSRRLSTRDAISYCLLPPNGGFHRLVQLVPDERMHAVPLGEPVSKVALVLPNALDEVGSDADVECASLVGCQDVHRRLLHGRLLLLQAGPAGSVPHAVSRQRPDFGPPWSVC